MKIRAYFINPANWNHYKTVFGPFKYKWMREDGFGVNFLLFGFSVVTRIW